MENPTTDEQTARRIDCPLACEIPAGFVEVPTPRHAWGDVIVCPNAECDRRRAFLRIPSDAAERP